MAITLICDWCGKDYTRPPSRAHMETKSNKHFCSKPCHYQWRTAHYEQPDSMKAKLSIINSGSGNPSWRGGDAQEQSGRMRALRQYPSQPCEVCESVNSERHHKDGNTLNNNFENIAFLCRKHHIEADRERGPHGRLVSKARK